MLRLTHTILVVALVATIAPLGARANESPGALLDEGLERLNRAFDELRGRAVELGEGINGHAVYVIDGDTSVWCPSPIVMEMILDLSPTEAQIEDGGLLRLRGGEHRLIIQPGAGCVLAE